MSQVRYGPARVVLSGDRERARGYLPKALQLLRVTQEQQRLGRLNTLRAHQDLDADSYCFVVLGGGMATVHIIAGYEPVAGEIGVERVEVPDFVSGTVRNGYIEPAPRFRGDTRRVLTSFRPTAACVATYEKWGEGIDPLVEGYQDVERLAVEPRDEFPELQAPPDGPASRYLYSQYTLLKPTMYSGSMRRLVQALMGFGRQRRKANENGSQREVSLYQRYRMDNASRRGRLLDERRYAEEVVSQGLQVRYDWRFWRTHGLHRAADGRWWLVEISSAQGVIAMPLPLHPETVTDRFVRLLEDRGDDDALRMIAEFGGFPTGQPFPPASQIEAWIRAGRVIRLVSRERMQEFYTHSSYSSDMGWAFNLRGDEAHNTAWRYGPDDVQRGVHYALDLAIGATREPNDRGAAIRAELERLRNVSAYEDGIEAAIWKCDWLSEAQRQAAPAGGRDLYEYMDRLTVSPPASGHGSLSKVSEGFLWFSPLAMQNYGNIIRFPETALGYLVSHDMRPGDEHAPAPELCDTTMFVFFAGNELKWVKFFWDMGPGAEPESESNYEDCMYIGRWERRMETGRRRIPLMFYTNDFDDREELPAGTFREAMEGKDLGYSSVTWSDFSVPYSNEGTISRTKRFIRKVEQWEETSPGLQSGVAVPMGEREAYYYAVYRSHGGKSYEQYHEYLHVQDPYRYQHWRNRAPWSGGEWSTEGEGWPPSDGEPPGTTYWIKLNPHPTGYGPVTVRTVSTPGVDYIAYNWLVGGEHRSGQTYFPSGCNDVADSGPWLFGGENATSLAYSIPAPPLPERIEEHEPGTGSYDVWLVNSSGLGAIRTRTIADRGFGYWPQQTPSPDGFFVQTIDMTCNTLGDGISARFGIDINNESEVRGSPNWPGMESRPLTYIGVING